MNFVDVERMLLIIAHSNGLLAQLLPRSTHYIAGVSGYSVHIARPYMRMQIITDCQWIKNNE